MKSSSTAVICSNVPEYIAAPVTSPRTSKFGMLPRRERSSTTSLWTAFQRATNARRRDNNNKTVSTAMTDEDDSLTVDSLSDTTEGSSLSEDDDEQDTSSSQASLPLRSCLSSSTTTGVEEKIKKSVQLNRHGRVKHTLHVNQYTQEEISSTWYSQTELYAIKDNYTKEKKRQALLGRVTVY